MNDPNVFYIDMGKRITLRRKMLGLSQEELAEKADVTPQLMSTAERGTKATRPENLLKISKALGVSTDYLLTGVAADNDYSRLYDKIKNLSATQLQSVEEIIDCCVKLCGK